MAKGKFNLSYSLAGSAVLVCVEWLLLAFVIGGAAAKLLVCAVALAGGVATLYVAAEIIEEVRSARHMIVLLSACVGEFVVFFAFQYWFLLVVEPASYPALGSDPVTLLLQSVMVFVFNPLYIPATGAGRALLLINTLASLGLVLFILQNVWQFRRGQQGVY